MLSPSPAPSNAQASFVADPAHADPSDLYPKVRARAANWSRGARLISISAGPFVGSKVDLTAPSAEIVYVFAAGHDATGHEQPPGQLALRIVRDGVLDGAVSNTPARAERATRDPTPPPAPRDPGEPNCVSDAAAKAARASGIPADAVLQMRYEMDSALGRGMWTARANGRAVERIIDGQTCAIVVHR